MSKFTLLRLVLPVALLGSGLTTLPAEEITNTLLHDTFAAATQNGGLGVDGNGYRAPTGSQAVWFGGGAVPTYTQNTSIKMSAGNRGLLAYIQPSTGLARVEPGETLTATVTFKYNIGTSTGIGATGDFRMGFLNSGGNGTPNNDGASSNPRPSGEILPAARIVTDNFSLTSTSGGIISPARGYSGYAVDSTAAPNPSPNTISFWRRDGGQGKSQQWLGPTSGGIAANTTFSQIGSTGGGTIGPIASNGTVYVATFSVSALSAPVRDSGGNVTRQGTTKVSYAITSDGATVMSHSITESADSPHVGFDAFMFLSLYGASFEVTDFLITKTSVSLGITGQPASQTVAAGTDATLSVTAVGAPAPTYQWQKDGVPIPGATSSTLALPNVQAAHAGAYQVVVSNANGTITSSTATLTVATTPVITSQPSGPTLFEGINTSLTVGVIGAAPLTYQWSKDGVAITDGGSTSGATSATLKFTPSAIPDSGVYTVTITNSFGSVTSSPATLTVYSATPPSFKAQPSSQTVLEGANVTFPVAIDGPPPFTYQWRKDGVNLVDDGIRVSGATTATLSLSAVRLGDAGNYSLVVRNAAASATSADAVLTVSAAPAPLAPTALGARNIAENNFTSRWTSSTHATGYRLDVSTDPAFGTFVTGYQDLDLGPVLSRALSGLTINTTYHYRVRAYNSTGTSAHSNVIAVTVQTPVPPSITSLPSTNFTAGVAGAFTLTATGAPQPTFAVTGLPAWLVLDAVTGLLSGTPPETAAGTSVALTINALNDTLPDATQLFTVFILAIPSVAEPLSVTTLAGLAGTTGSADGSGNAARFNGPSALAVDSSGNGYVADSGTHLIRKITSAGVVTTVAGKAGTPGGADGTGSAATFDTPSGVAVDGAGNLYVADTLNHTIRKITAAGVVTTFAGKMGVAGGSDGAAADARFFAPQGLALAPGGTDLYVADTNNHTVRRIALSGGTVTTLAGLAGKSGSANGTGPAARFNAPSDLAVDKNGNLYVADTDSGTIRSVTAAGAVTTLTGLAGSTGAADGSGAAARFNHPSALAIDGAFNLYVLDTDNHSLRKVVSALGVTTTIAGKAGASGSADGVGSDARFKFPAGLAVSPAGDLYIADTNNYTIRLGQLPNVPAITVQPQSASVTVGAAVQFTVKATGRPAVSYQWYVNAGPINGATNSTLDIASAQAVNAGDYTVVVSNAVGSVTSNRAGLVINPVPTTPVGINTGLGGGGGGAPSDWFYLALTLLAAARWATKRSLNAAPRRR